MPFRATARFIVTWGIHPQNWRPRERSLRSVGRQPLTRSSGVTYSRTHGTWSRALTSGAVRFRWNVPWMRLTLNGYGTVTSICSDHLRKQLTCVPRLASGGPTAIPP